MWRHNHSIETLERRRLLSLGEIPLTLISADSDQPVAGVMLEHGATFDLATTGGRLSIRADVGGPAGVEVESVRFNYDGNASYQIESAAPFAIAGDTAGGTDYFPWTPTLGTHSVIVSAYAHDGAVGVPLQWRAINFTVTDSSIPPAALLIAPGDSHFIGGQDKRAFRQGKDFSFAQDVPDGQYTLKLHFAEPHFKHEGKRVFDVYAEGAKLLDRFDIVAEAGRRDTLIKTFIIDITDGRLDLAFDAVKQQAIISAIELIPIPQTLSTPTPLYVNAGGPRIKDSLNRTFDADSGFAGGTTVQVVGAVADTDDDAIFNTFRSGNSFGFSRAVADGNYTAWLESAVLWFNPGT